MKRSSSRWFLIVILLVLFGVVAGIVLTRVSALAAPDQPIAYSHRVHIEAGLECLFCHSNCAWVVTL